MLTFLDAVSEKRLRSTVALTAARGRGKSAALGLCLAGAIAYGYANIFVTAPSPENLRTVFEFALKGGTMGSIFFCHIPPAAARRLRGLAARVPPAG